MSYKKCEYLWLECSGNLKLLSLTPLINHFSICNKLLHNAIPDHIEQLLATDIQSTINTEISIAAAVLPKTLKILTPKKVDISQEILEGQISRTGEIHLLTPQRSSSHARRKIPFSPSNENKYHQYHLSYLQCSAYAPSCHTPGNQNGKNFSEEKSRHF